jgi:hypothetical protein
MSSCSFMVWIKTTFPFTLKFWRIQIQPNYVQEFISYLTENMSPRHYEEPCVTYSDTYNRLLFLEAKIRCMGRMKIECCHVRWYRESNLSLSDPRRHIGWDEVWLHTFLISPLDRGVWWTSRPSRFNPWKECPYPLNSRQWAPQTARTLWWGETPFACTGNQSPDRWTHSLKHIFTTLLWIVNNNRVYIS